MARVAYQEYSKMLAKWVMYSQRHLYELPGGEGLICYGQCDHGHWGVQTQQKALSAFAVAAADPSIDWCEYGLTWEKVLSQALGMLRFNLRSHLTGDIPCTDGVKWGHSWIYMLGVERMMHGVEAIEEHLTDDDRERLVNMFASECEFLHKEFPIKAGLVYDNKPESNIWNGAALYRGEYLLPNHPDAPAWRRKAHEFFINGCSFESDAQSEVQYEDVCVKDAFVGANYFDSGACNHHGYLNVGYMVICLSNIAMLHFSYKARDEEAPEALYHRVPDVWRLVRECIFPDGRLNRIGGDTRVRYCYCQDYLMPSLLLMADKFGEDVSELEAGWLKQLQTETAYNGDGGFLSCRLNGMEDVSPVYYTRLESDRANVISMAAYWRRLYEIEGTNKKPDEPFMWQDDYHGAQFLRRTKRSASMVWHAAQGPQAMVSPLCDSSLAEWNFNLTGEIRGMGLVNGYDNVKAYEEFPHREIAFEGGFLSFGQSVCRSNNFLAEGQTEEAMADKMIAFAALPDDATALVIQRVVARNRTIIAGQKALFLNIPNDIFNDTHRLYRYDGGQRILRGAEKTDGKPLAAGRWLNADGKLGAAVLPGRKLTLLRPGKRQVGMANKPTDGYLYCDELVTSYSAEPRWYDRGEEIFREAFAVQVGCAEETEKLAGSLNRFDNLPDEVLSVCADGMDDRRYALFFNTGRDKVEIVAPGRNMETGEKKPVHTLNGGDALLIQF